MALRVDKIVLRVWWACLVDSVLSLCLSGGAPGWRDHMRCSQPHCNDRGLSFSSLTRVNEHALTRNPYGCKAKRRTSCLNGTWGTSKQEDVRHVHGRLRDNIYQAIV
ncbi:hypothetical protein BJV78DRAFT_1218740 [Lactifluus subvellereus]|nr:hypothetical protein BJV78DRAFT_1218740 [Lactifluus subvellereus]